MDGDFGGLAHNLILVEWNIHALQARKWASKIVLAITKIIEVGLWNDKKNMLLFCKALLAKLRNNKRSAIHSGLFLVVDVGGPEVDEDVDDEHDVHCTQVYKVYCIQWDGEKGFVSCVTQRGIRESAAHPKKNRSRKKRMYVCIVFFEHTYTVKKRLSVFPSPAGMSLTKPSLAGNSLIWFG
jgi:hypothetical protein